VTDAEPALLVWRNLLGLQVIDRTEDEIQLGVKDNVLIVLHPNAVLPSSPSMSGLYHVAIHVPSRRALARIILRLFSAQYKNSPTDHTVSEATYLWDYDGNGIEITYETPDRGKYIVDETGQLTVQDSQGNVVAPTLPLDLERVMAELGDHKLLDLPLAEGTKIGHVHLQVAELDAAFKFYRDVIGFEGQMNASAWGMADVNVPGLVPHIVAMNTWNSKGAPQPFEGVSGLQHFTVVYPTQAGLDEARTRLEAGNFEVNIVDDGLFTADPSGNKIKLTVAE
jgi:catechol 2,3-dioxygenase